MGERILHKDGYAQQIKKYEASGNMIEVSYFGIYGEPIQNIQGYARRTHTYNARVQIIEDAFFGVQGKAVFNRQGWHKSVNFLMIVVTMQVIHFMEVINVLN